MQYREYKSYIINFNPISGMYYVYLTEDDMHAVETWQGSRKRSFDTYEGITEFIDNLNGVIN